MAVPPGTVTVTSAGPDGRSGGRTTIAVFVLETIVAGVPPKVTAVAPARCAPAIVTGGPLRSGPAGAVSDVIVGGVSVTSALSWRS